MVTKEELHELFEYRADGNLVRKKSGMGPANKKGQVVGFKPKKVTRNNRYVTTKIQGEHWCVHKLIYLYHYGVLPDNVDHINGDSLDNRIENLRPASTSENRMNCGKYSNNTSGTKNVSWHKAANKWLVSLQVDNKTIRVGYFDDIELAELVAVEARTKYHGNYANHV